MANCAQYFVYALLLLASGLILQTKQRVEYNQVSDADEELDDWFTKIDSKKEEAEV